MVDVPKPLFGIQEKERRTNNINMGLSDEGEDATLSRYEDLCLDLNLDKAAKEEACENYQRISTNYTLEVGSVGKPCVGHICFGFHCF